ncbi:MAG TPA: Hsp20 family protein [Bryobacteraceae bacterium]|jgi:HSP20 family protein
MSQVSVRRVDGNNASSQSILESLNGISDSIRNRAFQLFESRGGDSESNSSNDLNDWLQAERDLFWIPQAELAETDRDYRMQVGVPGFDSKDLEVVALENMILIRGTSTSSSSAGDSTGGIRYTDFTSKMLMRRFDLNSMIDISTVTAKLDNGLLNITAMKAGAKSSAAKA